MNTRRTVCLILLGVLFASAGRAEVTYTYDAAGRLTTAYYDSYGTNLATHYQYDLAGNITNRMWYGPDNVDADYDADTLADIRELQYFGDLKENADGDPDGDGLVNSNEFAASGNPNLRDTDQDLQDDLDEFIAGTGLDDSSDSFYVTNAVQMAGGLMRVMCGTKSNRTYRLQSCRQPTETWVNVGSEYVASVDGPYYWDVPSETNVAFRIRAWLTSP